MYFKSFAEFVHMGGHAFYVWLCYGIVAVALVLTYVASVSSFARTKKSLERYYERLARKRHRGSDTRASKQFYSDSDI